MSRLELIERIKLLSEDEVDRVAPYIAADLDALADLDGVREEVRLGRVSAATEPMLEDADVLAQVLKRLAVPG